MSHFSSPYRSLPAHLERVIEETPAIKTFVLRPEVPLPFATGQFIELSIPGIGEAPFTPSSSPADPSVIEITVMRVGRLTERLHRLTGGETLGIRGPFGTGYPVDALAGRDILIVGGGVGMAPLRSFLLTVLSRREAFRRVMLCYGTKTPADIVYQYQFPVWERTPGLELLRSVDSCPIGAWDETVGLVTCLLDKVTVAPAGATAVVCGPPVMMKFTVRKLLELGFAPRDIVLSMEANMSCGLGKCGHCQLGPYFICKDGPVFTYEQLRGIPDPFA